MCARIRGDIERPPGCPHTAATGKTLRVEIFDGSLPPTLNAPTDCIFLPGCRMAGAWSPNRTPKIGIGEAPKAGIRKRGCTLIAFSLSDKSRKCTSPHTAFFAQAKGNNVGEGFGFTGMGASPMPLGDVMRHAPEVTRPIAFFYLDAGWTTRRMVRAARRAWDLRGTRSPKRRFLSE